MIFSLRELEADLQKVVSETSAETNAEGEFVWRGEDGEPYFWSPHNYRYVFVDVATLAEADHLMFLCPLCFGKNGGAIGTHSVMVTFAGRVVPDDAGSRSADGKPTRWTVVSGSSIDDLVLSPSILLNSSSPPEQGCHWHGFVGSSGVPPGHAGLNL